MAVEMSNKEEVTLIINKLKNWDNDIVSEILKVEDLHSKWVLLSYYQKYGEKKPVVSTREEVKWSVNSTKALYYNMLYIKYLQFLLEKN